MSEYETVRPLRTRRLNNLDGVIVESSECGFFGSYQHAALRLRTPPGSRMMSAARRGGEWAGIRESPPSLDARRSCLPYSISNLFPFPPSTRRQLSKRSLFRFRAALLDSAGVGAA